MNQDVDINRKLFWNEVRKMNGGMVEICNIIKHRDGKDEIRRTW